MFLFFHSDYNFLIIVVMEKIMIVCVEGNIGSGKSTLLQIICGFVTPERLTAAIKEPALFKGLVVDGRKQHVLVVAQQADDFVGRPGLKVDQEIDHTTAVWPAIDVIAEKDESASFRAGVALTPINEDLQLAKAAMGVAYCKGAGH